MKNKWHEIWSRKTQQESSAPTLERLIDADGFSSPFGRLEGTANWEAYTAHVAGQLAIQPGDSIFDVGCGAGAFLYPFYTKGYKTGGADYAANLLAMARGAMPEADLHECEAAAIDPAVKYDAVVSNGVFLYFPDFEYAGNVLRKMAEKTNRSIGIMDVPDLAKKDASLAERMKTMGKAEYEKKYKDLDHLYFSKDWFAEILGSAFKVEVFDQDLGGYGNSRFRFNVFARKVQ